jgi:hypothetical protein
VATRGPALLASSARPEPAPDRTLPARNRRTAFVLVAWIVVLMLASALVAWLRN